MIQQSWKYNCLVQAGLPKQISLIHSQIGIYTVANILYANSEW